MCDDDTCDLQSRVTLPVVADTTYMIRVAGYNGLRGDYTLTIDGPNCECVADEDCPETANPCTERECVAGRCEPENITGPCDDGDECTTGDHCVDGTCTGGAPPPCGGTECADCNDNGVRDDCEAAADCNGNGILDECEFADCNTNGVADVCDIAGGTSLDCDGGPIGSPVDGAALFATKCNACHGVDGSGGEGPDIRGAGRIAIWEKLNPPTSHWLTHPQYTPQDFANLETYLAVAGSGARPDRVLDECQTLADCDEDGVPDGCELEAGTQLDVDHDGIPDDCPDDCNNNGIPDGVEIADGSAPDCNGNDVPDSCDIFKGTSLDINENGTPDECDHPGKVTLAIEGDVQVVGGQMARYKAMAHFSDESVFEVSLLCDWSVAPAGAAAIDAFGRLTSDAVPCDRPVSIRAAFAFDGQVCEATSDIVLKADGTAGCDDGDPCTVDSCDAGSCLAAADATDTDGDTVRDCEDRCAGSDDRDDCDRNGTPDGCEIDSDGDGYPDPCDLKGDFDHQADVDLDDYWLLNICLSLSGPADVPPFFDCLDAFDCDDDGDVDLGDAAQFQKSFTGRRY